MLFSRALMQRECKPNIFTWNLNSIFHADNHYATQKSKDSLCSKRRHIMKSACLDNWNILASLTWIKIIVIIDIEQFYKFNKSIKTYQMVSVIDS